MTTIIAEGGSNWYDGSDTESRKRASQLVKSAANNGADIVKFQLFKADKLLREESRILEFRPFELPIGWIPQLKREAEDQGLAFLVTPFYPEAVDILENAGVFAYKVASTDITYEPLLKRIALTKKPVLLSTMGGLIPEDVDLDISFTEVDRALEILRPEHTRDKWGALEGCDDIVLLHCVSKYPAPIGHLNLQRIVDLGYNYIPLKVGFSSHCMDVAITASTINLQAEYIEVHFDLGDEKGMEAGHSYTPNMLQELVKLTRDLEAAQSCNCLQSFSDFEARKYNFRDSSDWLRPPLKSPVLKVE